MKKKHLRDTLARVCVVLTKGKRIVASLSLFIAVGVAGAVICFADGATLVVDGQKMNAEVPVFIIGGGYFVSPVGEMAQAIGPASDRWVVIDQEG